MSSREQILNRLRAAHQPFTDIPKLRSHRHMIPLYGKDLLETFVQEAEKLGCFVCVVENQKQAKQEIMNLIGEEAQVLAWDSEHIPVKSLSETLAKSNIAIAPHNDRNTLIGITGADAALAGTGSLVLSSGLGKFRSTSLLPDKHIAVITADQIVPDFETWVEQAKSDWQSPSNTVIISGPSKTADIGQILVKGAHGPRQLHIVVIK